MTAAPNRARFRGHRRRARDDRGLATLEALLTIPVLVLMIFAVIQVAMWWYDRQLASTAAQEAARAARAYNSTAAAGADRGAAYLQLVQGKGHALENVQIQVQRTAVTVTVTVSGDTVSLVPWLQLHVSESSTGPVERFVPVVTGGP